MECGPRRNSSLDMMNVTQVYIPTIRVTLQEAPVIETCLMNIREGRKPKNICKVEFNQPSCWLYSVSNLLVFRQLVTPYLGGILVRVVSEIV